MKKNTPTIIDLAFQYGSITREQFEKVISIPRAGNDTIVHDQIQFLLSRKWVTQYQMELLVLLRNYHIVRRTGDQFGQMVLEKGFASQEAIDMARDFQKEQFRKLRTKKLIGEILLEQGIITREQRDVILQEQALLAGESGQHPGSREDMGEEDKREDHEASEFSPDLYESRFLQIKTQDQEFSARLLEKGFATREQVEKARELHRHQRARGNQIPLLHEIMVNMGLISREQRDSILSSKKASSANADTGVQKAEQEMIPIEVPEQNLLARVSISREIFNEISSHGSHHIWSVLNRIRESAAEKQILQGISPDSLLFCHLKKASSKFFFACQDGWPDLNEFIKHHFSASRDPRERSVQKGDTIVRWEKEETSSARIMDVFGNEQELSRKLPMSLCCGYGVRISQDGKGLVADRSGRVHVDIDGKVFVCPELHVLEDMDQKYGPAPEMYADLFVSGIVTGAYPVTAGTIRAREIRGAEIDSLGDIWVEDGITDAVIRTRGSIHATYFHNCRIEAFGDICVENEILDCRIESSGKMVSPLCRVLSSLLFIRQGGIVQGIGSARSRACRICAGSDEHLVSCMQSIQEKIDGMESRLMDMEKRIQRLGILSEKTLRKMQDVKRFHDTARKKKQGMESRLPPEEQMSPEQQKNTRKLIEKFEERMNQAIDVIRELNPAKKKIDAQIERLQEKYTETKAEFLPRMEALTREMTALYQWAREQSPVCAVQCSGKALKGTVLQGIYSELVLEEDREDFTALEKLVPASAGHSDICDDSRQIPEYQIHFS